MIRHSTLALAGLLLAAAGPALAQNHARKVSPENLTDYWVRVNTHVYADAPNSGRGLDKVGCASVSYTIGTDGKTRHIKVEKVIPSTSDFQVTASSLVKGFQYRPSQDNDTDEPVQTYFIVPFNVPEGDAATMQKVLDSCRLPGYGD